MPTPSSSSGTRIPQIRPIGFGEKPDTCRYFSIDALVSYEISESIGVVGRVENISSGHLERWDRYEYAPVVVTAGVRLFW